MTHGRMPRHPVMAALTTLLLLLGVAPSTATAATDLAGVRIAVTTMAPMVAGDGDDVVITGRVTNVGSNSIDAPDVQLRGSFTPLTDRAGVAAWAAGEVADTGDLLDHDRLGGRLAPGAGASFRVVMKDPAATAGPAYGALPISLSAAGTRITSFVTYQRRREYVPLQLAVVAPLTLAPDSALVGDYGPERHTAWERQLGTGGRLPELIDATDDLPVTWALDPTIADPPAEIPAERPLDDVAGAAWDRIGADQKAETALRRSFAARLRDDLGTRPALVLPYADPDLSALVATHLNRYFPGLIATATRVAADLPGHHRVDVAWPADGLIGGDRITALTALYGAAPLSAVIGAGSSLGGTNTPVAANRAAGGTAVLAYDDALSGALLGLAADPDGTATRQLLLAQSLGLLAEFPSTRRSVLIAIPRGLGPAATSGLHAALAGLLDAPWITATSLDALRTQAALGPIVPQTTTPPAESGLPAEVLPPAAALTTARVRAATTALRSIAAMAQVRADGKANLGLWTETFRQLLASRWRDDPAALGHAIGLVRAAGAEARKGVAVTPEKINFFADSGLLTVTVTNDLDVAVDGVRVDLTPLSNRFRLEQTPAPVDIGPRSRANLRVRATALAAGDVPIKVSLSTPDGRRLGGDATVLVRAYPTGAWIYWVIGAAALLLFAGGLIRTRRRRRKAGS